MRYTDMTFEQLKALKNKRMTTGQQYYYNLACDIKSKLTFKETRKKCTVDGFEITLTGKELIEVEHPTDGKYRPSEDSIHNLFKIEVDGTTATFNSKKDANEYFKTIVEMLK